MSGGKLITINAGQNAKGKNSYVKLQGSGLQLYFFSDGNIRVEGSGNSGFIGSTTTDGTLHNIQIWIPASGKASVYGDGKKTANDVTLADGATYSLTGIQYTSTSTGGVCIDDIAVSDVAPTTYTVAGTAAGT